MALDKCSSVIFILCILMRKNFKTSTDAFVCRREFSPKPIHLFKVIYCFLVFHESVQDFLSSSKSINSDHAPSPHWIRLTACPKKFFISCVNKRLRLKILSQRSEPISHLTYRWWQAQVQFGNWNLLRNLTEKMNLKDSENSTTNYFD